MFKYFLIGLLTILRNQLSSPKMRNCYYLGTVKTSSCGDIHDREWFIIWHITGVN